MQNRQGQQCLVGRLRRSVWERRGIGLITKLKVYQAVVITTLLYPGESWTVYSRHARQLNHFHTTCLRRLMKVRLQDHIPDTEILSHASIHTLIEKARARWAGHVLRMNDQRISKLLAEDKRQVGRPNLHFKDNLKATLKSLDIPVQTWEDLASDRPQWRRMNSTNSTESAEQHRRVTAERKRAARKAKTAGDTTQPPASLKCSICDCHFPARIGHAHSHIQPVTMKSWSSSATMDEHHHQDI